jgi:hypothetical protein
MIMNMRKRIPAVLVAVLLTPLVIAGAAMAQPAGSVGNSASPNPGSNTAPSRDLQCRRQAASQTGYRADGSGNASEEAYGSAYYDCMDTASNAPPRPRRYYDEDDGPYPYPAPYPYPYPYPYYGGPYYGGPYYGGPAIGLSFGFGGRGYRGHRR